MATTQEILSAAADLGKLIAAHPAAVQFESIVKQLQADVQAQRLMTDLNRHIEKLGEKESQGKPIEVADKKTLEELQNKVIRHPLLSKFQMAQMDYLDLMRQVDQVISGGGEPAAGNPPENLPPGVPAPGSDKLN
jgi:cell fate (sporulation/competence/biofilm development) regulator YlbF (YheA/YmcA/DUF963 family)